MISWLQDWQENFLQVVGFVSRCLTTYYNMKKKIDIRFIVLLAIVLAVGLWRIVSTGSELSKWANFTPIGAMALFAGTFFTSRVKSYLTPILILLISDVVLMLTIFAPYRSGLLYSGWYWTYGSFALMVWVGERLKHGSSLRSVVLGSILAGSFHYVITNFGVWLGGGIDLTTGLPYTRDWAGFLKCYVLALPYFKNLLLGNLIFGTFLFGGFEVAQKTFPVLRLKPNHP